MSAVGVDRLVGGRYRTTSLLHQGQGIDTYLARDVDGAGAPVVVKLAPAGSVAETSGRRLEHETAILGRLHHPNLVRLLDRGRDEDGSLFLVTPWVPGRSLAARLLDGPLGVRETVTVACDVVAALCHAHDLGVLHRDVKPANVVVDGDPVERAVLIDFGLARSELLEAELRDVPVGSVRYLAPEQTGLLPGLPDERSDLHAVGLVLFECLLGRPVHDGERVGDVLKQQMSATPPLLGPPTPRILAQIVDRLVRRDPAERYQTAAGLAHDLQLLAGALDDGLVEPTFVLGGHDRRVTLAEPGFVGRQAQLGALEEQVRHAAHGQGGVVLLGAESGGGKTRLLDELARRVPGRVRRFHGQGLDQTAQRPFQVLSGVARDLARATSDEALATQVRRRLGDQAEAVATAFPELAGALGIDVSVALGPEEFGEVRTVAALATLLDSLGTAEHPALVVLDDCQWADQLSDRLLHHWNEQRATPCHVLVVAAFRSDELPVESVLRRLDARTRVDLPPLGVLEVRALVTSMAGAVPDEAVDVVVRLAEGSPFMAAAVLRGLLESGALVSGPGGWSVDPDALADVSSSRRAATVLAHRITLLGEETRRLLAVGAVLGKEFEPAVAAALGGVGPTEVARAVREASRRHLLWDQDAAHCRFVHDKVREALLAGLDDGERRHLHEQTAVLLEERSPTAFFDLAYHFDEAGLAERGLPYALAAAEEARAQQSLELVEQQYRIARRGVGASPDRRGGIAEELGRVLMLRGRYDEAAVELEEARRLAADADVTARIDATLGELWFKRGDMARSSEALERALGALGRRVPQRGLVVAVLWQVLVQALHTLLPGRFGRRPVHGERAERDLLAARLYSRLAHTYWFQRGSLATLYVHLRGMNLAERFPPTAQRAQAWSEHAPVMSLLPWYRRGVDYAERSHAIRVELGDLYGQGQSRHFLGVVLYAASRWDEAAERCREAVRLLDRTGDRWEANTARWHIGYCAYRKGDMPAAAEMGEAVWRAGTELGDPQARGIGLAVWAKATDGRIPADAVEAELADLADDVHTAAEVLTAEALRQLALGSPVGAVACLERAEALVRRAGLRQEYVAPVPAWLLTALRARRAAETGPTDLRTRRRELHQARRVGRRARRLARWYRNNAPHALREAALVEAELGRLDRARRWLDRSIRIAEELGARSELARSLEARGAVGRRHGWPGAEEDLEVGRRVQEELRLPSPARTGPASLSLVDRFDTLLAAGRSIASTLDVDGILHELVEWAEAAIRPQDCLVLAAPALERSPTPDALEVVAGTGAEPSRSVVAEAMDRGSVVVHEVADADASDSLVLSGVRSVLAAAVRVRGEPVACLFVSHRDLGGVFGDDEVRIAGFLTALAGAALENAEGFAEVQALTASLEERVAERTAALRDAYEQLDERIAELRDAYEREQQITDRLRRLDQFKTELVAITAHDLRTPLAIIIGFAQTLTDFGDRLDDDERTRLLGRIVSNTRRLSEFVENLLQFARIESGELEVAQDPLDLAGLVHRTVGELATHETGRPFHLDVDDDLPTVLGDEARQWQVLMNLLSNACKHSEPDAAIRVTATRRGDVVEVTVADEGPGIPASEIPKLFGKFSRIDSAGSAKQAMGTGLGLYICRSLVEAHGGTIRVASEEGVGTTVTYEVPIGGRPAPADG
ncbi:MAG TPA: ATP-binding protein [Acidimicrobiales bacterium]|nr:ATP-binding protein [Acidimicrobiales bacterium]